MELETVGGVSMSDHGLEVGGKIDDHNGFEGTFFRADTATDAEPFRDEGDFGGTVDFDAQFACSDDGARLLALLTTFLERYQKAKGFVWRYDVLPWACTVTARNMVLVLLLLV
jgi:hypothetical protein